MHISAYSGKSLRRMSTWWRLISAAQVQAPDLRGQGVQGREAFAYEPAPGKWAGKATISVSHTRDSAMPVT